MEKKIENFEIKNVNINVIKEELVKEINHGLFEEEK